MVVSSDIAEVETPSPEEPPCQPPSMVVTPDVTEIETLVHDSDAAAVAQSRCPPHHPSFPGGRVRRGHLVVFPRTRVIIERESRPPVHADPNTVVFYNEGEEYGRTSADRRGDHCDWFALEPQIAADLVADLEGEADPMAPFGFTDGPAPTHLYMRQRQLVEALSNEDHPDPFAVDEAVLAIVAAAAAAAVRMRNRPIAKRPTTEANHVAVVHDTKTLLAERYATNVTLRGIAAQVGSSPYHLARIFHRHTGFTLHGYLTQLRLRAALGRVADREIDLAALALELGFASHSHFTSSFRSAFGMPPSEVRRLSRSGREEMSTMLTS